MAKKKKAKNNKKALKQHAKELHAISRQYTNHALSLSILHRHDDSKKEIKNQIQKIEQNLQKLVKLTARA